MQALLNKARRLAGRSSLLADTRGLSTVEYVIILVLIAVVGILAWSNFGDAVKAKIDTSTGEIEHLGDRDPSNSSGDDG